MKLSLDRWRTLSPPIWLQILALLIGGLLAAQLVTLALTLLLPPEPPQRHSLPEVAAALGRSKAPHRTLLRSVEAAPPSLASPDWVTSEPSTRELARLLGVQTASVRLLFYLPPPLASRGPRLVRPGAAAGTGRGAMARLTGGQAPVGEPPIRVIPQVPGGAAVGAGAGPPPAGALPARVIAPPGPAPSLPRQVISPVGAARPPAVGAAQAIVIPHIPTPPPEFQQELREVALIPMPSPLFQEPAASPEPVRRPQPQESELMRLPQPQFGGQPVVATPAAPAPLPARLLPRPGGRSMFGLGGPAYVEGEFIAALRTPDGRWATVRPRPEGFPNSWQRRVLLWFALAFGLVAPAGLLLAHRLASPLTRFALAAEQLGRDPAAAALPELSGPAEVGQAARAFNQMQARLRRYIDDRTRMIGAISHDLRMPLARMRFKAERLAPEAREAFERDIRHMEQMLESVLNFMRDETLTGGRQRVDLRSLLECVVDQAAGDVTLDAGPPVEVEVDILGVQRAFENLVSNAVKYGGGGIVRLAARDGEALVEVADEGPGLDDDELIRVFKPFYRDPHARQSGKAGVGLGLAVSRATLRAHGGELTLRRTDPGLVAEARLPLAG